MNARVAGIVLGAVLALGACSWLRPSAAPANSVSPAPGSGGAAAPASAVPARIEVTHAWVRPATSGQAMVPAYVDLRAGTTSTLVAVESPVAQSVEIRQPAAASAGERTLIELALPRDTTVRLAPGGNYLALLGVHQAFANGESVPLWFTFRDPRGGQYIVRVEAQVRGLSLRADPRG